MKQAGEFAEVGLLVYAAPLERPGRLACLPSFRIPMPQPDLIIFDCDGVLVDSEIIAARVEAELLTLAGFEITPRSFPKPMPA